MRLNEKVSCVSCHHYGECSNATRFFVNYCGSRSSDIEKQINKATQDCMDKHGRIFKRVILSNNMKKI